MSDFHDLLRRQLKRHLPGGVPAGLEPMLAAIDEAYRQFDRDRAMLEQSLDLSSQELLQANTQLRALVSAFPDQIVRIDAAGTILDVKGAAPAEPTRRWVAGRRLSDIVDGAARDAITRAMARVAAEQVPLCIEIELGTETPAARFYEARLLPMADAQVLLILRDVTERHYAENQLRASQMALHEAHRDLERRVEERTAALGRANDELRREMADRQAAESARGELEESTAPRAEDGGDRPPLGRHRARLQQPADRDPRLLRAAVEGTHGLAAAGGCRGDLQCRRARGDAHRASCSPSAAGRSSRPKSSASTSA